MIKIVTALGAAVLPFLAPDIAKGQPRPAPRPVAVAPSLVTDFWKRNAHIDVGASNETLVDILVRSLVRAEAVDRVAALQRRSGRTVNQEQLDQLWKVTDPELESIISASPASTAKVEALSALFFYRQVEHIKDVEQLVVAAAGGRVPSPGGLASAEFLDMATAFNQRMGRPLSKPAKDSLSAKSGLVILFELGGARLEYLRWSRSRYLK